MMEFKYNEEYLKQLCKEKDLEFVGVSYKVFDKKRRCVDFICNKHRHWGIQTRPVEKLKYKQPCQYCSHKRLKDNFKEEVYKINPNIEVIGKYVNSDDPILCKCKIDGYEWMAISRGLLQGEGCPQCGKQKSWDVRGRINTEEFIQRMKDINPNIEIIGEYTGAHEFIRCRCKKHGTEWESYACNLQNQTANCPDCSNEWQQSKGERRLIDILISKGRNITSEHIFEGCKYKSHLRFDVYDIDNNIAYEYQGEQHYRPVAFTGNPIQAEKDFLVGLKRDAIKETYCKEHNITLIKIPYWDFDDMEKYII